MLTSWINASKRPNIDHDLRSSLTSIVRLPRHALSDVIVRFKEEKERSKSAEEACMDRMLMAMRERSGY
jgi:hypothetical protein